MNGLMHVMPPIPPPAALNHQPNLLLTEKPCQDVFEKLSKKKSNVSFVCPNDAKVTEIKNELPSQEPDEKQRIERRESRKDPMLTSKPLELETVPDKQTLEQSE